jgi:hypothetical protein
MAAGVTDRLFAVSDLVTLLELRIGEVGYLIASLSK